jgi:hypothetical protein
MFEETGCDAVMIGRGAIGNPWVFGRARSLLDSGVDPGPPDIHERARAYLQLLDETLAEKGEPRGVFECAPRWLSERGRAGVLVKIMGSSGDGCAFASPVPPASRGGRRRCGRRQRSPADARPRPSLMSPSRASVRPLNLRRPGRNRARGRRARLPDRRAALPSVAAARLAAPRASIRAGRVRTARAGRRLSRDPGREAVQAILVRGEDKGRDAGPPVGLPAGLARVSQACVWGDVARRGRRAEFSRRPNAGISSVCRRSGCRDVAWPQRGSSGTPAAGPAVGATTAAFSKRSTSPRLDEMIKPRLRLPRPRSGHYPDTPRGRATPRGSASTASTRPVGRRVLNRFLDPGALPIPRPDQPGPQRANGRRSRPAWSIPAGQPPAGSGSRHPAGKHERRVENPRDGCDRGECA